MNPVILTDEQQQQLTQLKRTGRNHEERWRAGIIWDLARGLRRAEVAERNDCSISGVDKTLSRFRRDGVQGLRSVRFKPHRRKLSPEGFLLLSEVMRQSPRAACPGQPEFDRSLWTLQLLVEFLQQTLGVRVTDDTVRRYLKELGWTTRSPKLTCKSPDPEYTERMAAIGELRRQAEKKGTAHRWCSITTRPN